MFFMFKKPGAERRKKQDDHAVTYAASAELYSGSSTATAAVWCGSGHTALLRQFSLSTDEGLLSA